LNDKEIDAGYSHMVECFPIRGAIEIDNLKAKDPRKGKKSMKDAVYNWNSCQDDIYKETLRPLITSVFDGFNGPVFAYGQT
jgi:kinesin family protein 3/17